MKMRLGFWLPSLPALVLFAENRIIVTIIMIILEGMNLYSFISDKDSDYS